MLNYNSSFSPLYHLWLVGWNFAQLPSTLSVWSAMFFSTFVPYTMMKYWAHIPAKVRYSAFHLHSILSARQWICTMKHHYRGDSPFLIIHQIFELGPWNLFPKLVIEMFYLHSLQGNLQEMLLCILFFLNPSWIVYFYLFSESDSPHRIIHDRSLSRVSLCFLLLSSSISLHFRTELRLLIHHHVRDRECNCIEHLSFGEFIKPRLKMIQRRSSVCDLNREFRFRYFESVY